MSLGLSHSLSRHKLKFSPDKVDTMIVQAIALLDDLDKELNTYAMRVKEWYGWHFPEMNKIVNDNLACAKIILKMGMRTSAAKTDLAEILPEEIETAVKAAAEISMGTEITTEDLDNIQALAEQVVSFTEYRSQLSSYLSARMTAIAPNLTTLVGDLVGARLIAHAGSLMNLAKSPASTIQILGAEKALFRALKTKHDTPKYGLIYHASLIGQATGKNKGKIARMLATKAALGLRVDALADWSAEGEGKGDFVTEEEKCALGQEGRYKVERRLANLEGRPLRPRGVAIGPNSMMPSQQPGKWEVKEARKYNPDADGLAGDEPAAAAPVAKKDKKEKKLKSSQTTTSSNTHMSDIPSKNSKEDQNGSTNPAKLIEVIEEENGSDEDASDEDASGDGEPDDEEMEDAPQTLRMAAKSSTVTNGTNFDDKSETISTVSADTPESPTSLNHQESKWESSILGDTKEAKKARKKEKHDRKLALSEDKSKAKALKEAKLARRLDRKERRRKRAEQLERREERDDRQYKDAAEKAGLSISRYKRKLERGEIKFNADGTPEAISKKEIKKTRKEAEKAVNGEASGGKKRKRDDVVEVTGKAEKAKKKKSKSSA